MTIERKNQIQRCLVLATVFLIPFYFFRFKILGVPTNVFEIAVLVSAVAVFSSRHRSLGWWPWALSAVALIVAIFSHDRIDALGIFKGWFLVPTIFAWTIVQVFDAQTWRRLRLPLFVVAIIIALWAIAQKYGFLTTAFYQNGDASFNTYLSEGRAFGPFESPNYLAMFLTPVLLITAPIFASCRKRMPKILSLVGIIIITYAITSSTSRGGQIALDLAILLFVALSLANRQKQRSPKITTIVILSSVVLANAAYFLILPRVDTAGGDSLRREITEFAWQMARQHPLWGIGLGNFQNAIGQISIGDDSFQTYALPFALHPHNLFLALWLNLGLAGLMVFFGLVVGMLKRLATHPEGLAVSAALFAILIHGIFDTTYFKNDLSAIFWLIFAISLLLAHHSEPAKAREE
jgi:O-antigen ligase